jgi:hypothetical protein
VAFALH